MSLGLDELNTDMYMPLEKGIFAKVARFMGPIWGRQDPGGPHVGPMNFAIWVDRYRPTSQQTWGKRAPVYLSNQSISG